MRKIQKEKLEILEKCKFKIYLKKFKKIKKKFKISKK
jgi:hypothetical protein